ncbi:uncharacterized protein LACBIDRAFT_327892 [Laccaria bicolor S238N-H82]|uniref:Predicted protein n=1 Tax=Laccaria bicolor (strain S238N-H82 / ATCC MYA-4686) TaxID=486041 RepID=B0DD52_LACBS|nr:uncharacterized protein LACBIDRAFT_327892 [Laccaria bicolor S238N-H82]EDR07548.1 predicted protein [Laccaria bicolor S238N-H82]|eukprot:XP_001881940.1 predicted protein [Laccaria bicolor S238N-H82]
MVVTTGDGGDVAMGPSAKFDSSGIPGIPWIPPDSSRNQWRTIKTSKTVPHFGLKGGGGEHFHGCMSCSSPAGIYRCEDCLGPLAECLNCTLKRHRQLPLHIINKWDGAGFDKDKQSAAAPLKRVVPCNHSPTSDLCNFSSTQNIPRHHFGRQLSAHEYYKAMEYLTDNTELNVPKDEATFKEVLSPLGPETLPLTVQHVQSQVSTCRPT